MVMSKSDTYGWTLPSVSRMFILAEQNSFQKYATDTLGSRNVFSVGHSLEDSGNNVLAERKERYGTSEEMV